MAKQKAGNQPIDPAQVKEAQRERGRPQSSAKSAGESNDKPLMVVGVGASAGGLDAFTHVLQSLTDGLNLAIILSSILRLSTRACWRRFFPRTPNGR